MLEDITLNNFIINPLYEMLSYKNLSKTQ
jgi:hypothetical protein